MYPGLKSCGILILFAFIFLTSCEEVELPPESVQGYEPIYYQKSGTDTVTFKSSEPIVNGGKIFINGSYLYQVELYRGIHIIDISDPEESQKIGFYDIYGCIQMTMEGPVIYANANGALIAFDVSILEQPKVVTYWPDYFENVSFPEPPNPGYFECVDPSKGIVVGWNIKVLNNPHCRY